MASPQCENGYIRFASELWESLCRIRIPGEARQVFDLIARKTYGYNKKEDAISLSQFVVGTGMKKPDICQEINRLKKMNLISQKANDIANIYSINKDFQSWKPLPKKQTFPKKQMTITQKANESLPKKLPTIDNIQKTLLQKTIKTYCPNSDEVRLSELLLNKILERRPTYKKPNIQNWCKDIDKMIRIDKRYPVEIEKIINWCQNDSFWKNNILSMDKLRKQYDQLALKMEGKYDGQAGRSKQPAACEKGAVEGKYSNLKYTTINNDIDDPGVTEKV